MEFLSPGSNFDVLLYNLVVKDLETVAVGGDVVQWVEFLTLDQEVPGSNPSSSPLLCY